MSANTGVSMCRSSHENVVYECVLTSPAVLSMSYLSYLVGLWEGIISQHRVVFYGLLLQGFVKNITQHSYVASTQAFGLSLGGAVDTATDWKNYVASTQAFGLSLGGAVDTATDWKNSSFILSGRSYFQMIDNQSIAIRVFTYIDITFSR